MARYKKGFTTGAFDLFHVGHVNLLKTARQYCDYLIVGVNSDEIIEKYKQKKAIISEADRIEIIEAIKYVDEAFINITRDYMTWIEKYKFDAIFVGDDWKGTGRWNNIEKALKEYNIDVIYIPYTKRISSTKIRTLLNCGDH